MANIASARKRARQAVQLNAQFRASMSVIDSIADKKIIHKNAAARHKSRLSAAIKAMA